MLKESVDVSALGVDTSPSPFNKSFGSPAVSSSSRNTPRAIQPSTPTVVPPTPTPVAGPSTGKMPQPSPPSSSHDLFYEPEDSERQTNRRSMYRSPGTSSSPDLATLLRKAKERGGVVTPHHKREKRRESPPPMPSTYNRSSTSTSTTRQRSSTSHSTHRPPSASPMTTTPSSKTKPNGNARGIESSPGWASSARLVKENGQSKVPKSSVRSMTSAFLGKMLGQSSTTRERSKTDAGNQPPAANTPLHSSPSIFEVFSPPLPPLPADQQRSRSPKGSPIADVFSAPQRPPSVSKPLPPIISQSPVVRESEDSDERSMVFVERIPPVPPPDSVTHDQLPNIPSVTPNYGKRRSMSVGDVDLRKAMTAMASVTPLPRSGDAHSKEGTPRWEETTLPGFLDDFKGVLSKLDPVSDSSLDLRDPSTPARRAAFRSKTEAVLSSPATHGDRPEFKKSVSTPPPRTAPLLTLQLPAQTTEADAKDDLSPIVPPRTSSLPSPVRSSFQPTPIGPPRVSNSRHGSSPLRSRSGPSSGMQSPQSPRDSTRLRVLHRSTASNSEPSLIPTGDEPRVLSPHRRSSQQELSVKDLGLSRFSSLNQNPPSEDPVDIETRGKELASRCWHEDEEFLAKEKIAEWLGGHGLINKVTLHYYIDLFDFSGLRLDLAFRRLCAKLFLKGETQQVDRILEAFSRRYWECNPSGVYGSANIVHAVSYSLLLLNTDLHVADLTTRMSRSQFVRNTITAIQMQLQPTPSTQLSVSDLTYDDCTSIINSTRSDDTETISRSKRSDSIASWNSISREVIMSSAINQASLEPHQANGSTPSVQISSGYEPRSPNSNFVYGRGWEGDMELLLKEMYNAIKSQQILQPISTRSSVSSLSPGGSGMTRNRSLRGPPDRLTTLKRGSIRGWQSILGAQSSVSPYSSNSSIDGRVSPSPSFATSTHEAMYGSSSSFLTPTLGFASNLSHTIIREAQEDDDRSVHSENSTSTTISITDEELALLGAPWAKEGMLGRKQYWESTGKRAKDKTWLGVFVVIQKGELNMFTFGDTNNGSSGTFGGGNWLSNAHSVGAVHLSHSLAHALPPPGYNRQRPYCMVLTLSNGGVYFFQAGTEELVNEWVSTCNYWAARTSKEPLAGGVSNMEYGWNRVADPQGHDRSQSVNDAAREVDHSDSVSVRSGRSSRSKFSGWREGAATVRAAHSPWADRTFINDWKPPMPPTVSSPHDEETQLEALRKHVASMKMDLESHNEFREPMAALYQPRSANALKAQSNWEKKSQYLLTEIVKYDSYIDSLQAAMSLRLKRRGEKALERALNGTPADESQQNVKGKWKGPEQETIREEAEPSTPGLKQQFTRHHRREMAEGGDVEV